MRTLRQKRRSRVRTNQKKVVKTTFQFQAIFPNQTLHQKDVTESAPLPSRRGSPGSWGVGWAPGGGDLGADGPWHRFNLELEFLFLLPNLFTVL